MPSILLAWCILQGFEPHHPPRGGDSGFLWIVTDASLDFYWFLWISMDFCGGFDGYLWIFGPADTLLAYRQYITLRRQVYSNNSIDSTF